MQYQQDKKPKYDKSKVTYSIIRINLESCYSLRKTKIMTNLHSKLLRTISLLTTQNKTTVRCPWSRCTPKSNRTTTRPRFGSVRSKTLIKILSSSWGCCPSWIKVLPIIVKSKLQMLWNKRKLWLTILIKLLIKSNFLLFKQKFRIKITDSLEEIWKSDWRSKH